MSEAQDYDAGLLNDYGGGNVEWWQDYLRAEIERANDHWRTQFEAFQAEIAAREAASAEAMREEVRKMLAGRIAEARDERRRLGNSCEGPGALELARINALSKALRHCLVLPLPHASALARALAAAERRGMERAEEALRGLIAAYQEDANYWAARRKPSGVSLAKGRIRTVEAAITRIRNAAAQESEG